MLNTSLSVVLQVRKHMGLAVPDDEDSPSPPPQQSADVLEWRARLLAAAARHAADREREERENAAAGNGSAPAGETAAAPGDAKDGEATRDDETSPRGEDATPTAHMRKDFDAPNAKTPRELSWFSTY